MTILYVTSEYHPQSSALVQRSSAHVAALTGAGHRVKVFSGPGAVSGPAGEETVSVNARRPLNTQGMLGRIIREIIFGLSLALRIIGSRGAELVVITSPPFFMTLICATAARLRRIPYILDIRDRYPQVFFSLGIFSPESLPGKILRGMERRAYRKARRVVTVTDELVIAIEVETGVRPALVMNGYRDGLFKIAESYPGSGPFRLVMHGNFSKFFDFEIFTALLEKLDTSSVEFRVTVIGSGSRMDDIAAIGSPILDVHQAMLLEDIAAKLAESHAGLSIHSDNVSMRGAFPVKVFEFIGAGLPSLVIPENSAGAVVGRKGLGFSCGGEDLEKAVGYLEELARNPESYADVRSRITEEREFYARHTQAGIFTSLVDDGPA